MSLFKWRKKETPEEEGMTYYKMSVASRENGCFADETEQLHKSAELGCPQAFVKLGQYYFYGDEPADICADNEKAVYWMEKAMAGGQTDVENDLAVAYKRLGNLEKAAEHYTHAAEAGDPAAQHNLACLYREGNGVPQDDGKSAFWMSRSSDQSYAPAQRWMGYYYETGCGVEIDEKKAAELYRMAAEQNDTAALCDLSNCYRLGIGVEQDAEQAFSCIKAAADQDKSYLRALFILGWFYETGCGTEQDLWKAAELYLQAAESGYLKAQERREKLGALLFDEGKKEGSTELCRISAFLGSADARDYLWKYGWNQHEELSAKAWADTLRWCRLSAEAGKEEAQDFLPVLLSAAVKKAMGLFDDEDRECRAIFEEAAKTDDVIAMFYLGMIYHLDNDAQTALDWYNRARSHAKGYMLDPVRDSLDENIKACEEYLNQ